VEWTSFCGLGVSVVLVHHGRLHSDVDQVAAQPANSKASNRGENHQGEGEETGIASNSISA
jgi:hypothetical protein